MRKGLTEMVFVLDRSGSMAGLEEDTIGGFNSMIAKQKKAGADAIVTTVLFSTEHDEIHSHVSLKEIKEMTEDDYITGGGTALLDAFGGAIEKTRDLQSYLKEEDRPEKTIFVVITDGHENSSRVYTNEKVKALVEKQKEEGWEFLFLGANIDAFAVGGRLGIRRSRICKMADDRIGTALAYEDVGDFMSECMDAEDMSQVDDDWCEASRSYCMKHEDTSF